ncbi:MAG TPA: glycosyltransferase family 39 protein [Chroococcales cyanobacterium]
MNKLNPVDAGLAGVVVFAFVCVFVYSWKAALGFPFAIEYEGPMYWAVSQLAAGQNIYDLSQLSAFPYAVITYPPLFMLLSAVVFKLSIVGQAFTALRLVSVVATIISIYLFYRILRTDGCGVLEGIGGAAYFFGFTPVFLWANIGRPDALMVMFVLASMERFVTFRQSEQVSGGKGRLVDVALAGVLMALACFTKQTAIVGVASVCLFLLTVKKFKALFLYGGSFALLFAVLAGAAQMVSGGFIANMTIFGTTPWSQEMMWRYLHFMSDGDTYRMEILVVVLLYCLIFKKQNITETERLPYIFLAASFAQMMYMFGLPGSNGNHAILPFLAWSWWLALKLTTLPRLFKNVVVACSLLGIWTLAAMVPSIIAGMPKNDDVLQTVNWKDQLVLSEDPYINRLTESKPAMIDCAVFTSIWQRQPQRLVELRTEINDLMFAAIVINCQDVEGKRFFWPPEVIDSIKQRYRPIGECNGNGLCQKVFVPKI